MASVDYSQVAAVYRWLERLVFGSRLQQARVGLLDDVFMNLRPESGQRVLVVGDGDGRFLEVLLGEASGVLVDYVDCSEGMLLEAQARVNHDARVRWFCGDVREWHSGDYDAVVAHFVLDSFEGEPRQEVVDCLVGKVAAGGCLLISDFDPKARVWAPFVVKLMQGFFALFAKIPFVDVTRDDAAFEALGAVMVRERLWQGGWIYSQLWKM